MERSDHSFSRREEAIRAAIAEARAERERLEHAASDRKADREAVDPPAPAAEEPSPA